MISCVLAGTVAKTSAGTTVKVKSMQSNQHWLYIAQCRFHGYKYDAWAKYCQICPDSLRVMMDDRMRPGAWKDTLLVTSSKQSGKKPQISFAIFCNSLHYLQDIASSEVRWDTYCLSCLVKRRTGKTLRTSCTGAGTLETIKALENNEEDNWKKQPFKFRKMKVQQLAVFVTRAAYEESKKLWCVPYPLQEAQPYCRGHSLHSFDDNAR